MPDASPDRPGWYHRSPDGSTLTLSLHVQPGARATEVAGLHGAALKLRLAAPPVEGKANTALIAWLADAFRVPARQVRLVRGEKSRSKTVRIEGTVVDPASLLPGRD